ncbi:hypothetical protein Pan216_07450 [Planctomycetes bacterium Pan216]|uniref:Uncharacterized protein n=1 Tax=Kolteria novifilia TaxID=2527975 RepID=A0A518AYX7_9BACT|nr:hypothetical protein Pan216_07450 [Planctomycetes bacterium Pan216]
MQQDGYKPAVEDLRPAHEVLTREFTKLSKPAKALVKPEYSCGEYLRELLRTHLLEDGIEFIGHALPLRHAVWWGCCCLATVTPPKAMTDKDRQAFGASYRWVVEPTDRHRAYAESISRVVLEVTPPLLLARATGYPKFKLPDPIKALKRNFNKEGVITAVNVATVDAEEIDEIRRKFIEVGLAVSRNKIVWRNPGQNPIPQ